MIGYIAEAVGAILLIGIVFIWLSWIVSVFFPRAFMATLNKADAAITRRIRGHDRG